MSTLCKICSGACHSTEDGGFVHDEPIEKNLRRYGMEHTPDPATPAELAAFLEIKRRAKSEGRKRVAREVLSRVSFGVGVFFPI